MLKFPISYTLLNKLAYKSEKNRLRWTEERLNLYLFVEIFAKAKTLNGVFLWHQTDIWNELIEFEHKQQEVDEVESHVECIACLKNLQLKYNGLFVFVHFPSSKGITINKRIANFLKNYAASEWIHILCNCVYFSNKNCYRNWP